MKFEHKEMGTDFTKIKAALYRMHDKPDEYCLAINMGTRTLWMYEKAHSNFIANESIGEYIRGQGTENPPIRLFYEGDKITLTF